MRRPLPLALPFLLAGCLFGGDTDKDGTTDAAAPAAAPTAAAAGEQPAYSIVSTYGAGGKSVTGTLGGQTVTLLDLAAGTPASAFPGGAPPPSHFALIDTVANLDGDGVLDALVSLSDGGNATGPLFHVVSLLPGGQSRVSPAFEMGWGENYRIVADASGPVLEYRLDDAVTRLAYRDGAVTSVGQTALPQAAATAEIAYATLANGQFPVVGEEYGETVYALNVDLNADGQADRLACRPWERWSSVVCKVQRADGAPMMAEELPACERIGVLATRTGGMADLACNGTDVLRWNGTAYAGEVGQ